MTYCSGCGLLTPSESHHCDPNVVARWERASGPRVLVPYVKLHPATEAALDLAGAWRCLVETSAPTCYWQALGAVWAERRSFIVLEQDKVPEPGLLQELWDCPAVWCSARVSMRGTVEASPYPSLSCTKFHRDLIVQRPTLMDDVGELDLGFGEKEWSRLDMAIAGLLQPIVECHYHPGVVEHLHEPLAD